MGSIEVYLFVLSYFVTGLKANEWNHETWLDPHEKFHVKWTNDYASKTITFFVEVKTRGWIGFGLSPNGGMKNSDIIIAWVDDNDGKTYFHVRNLYVFNILIINNFKEHCKRFKQQLFIKNIKSE